MDWLTVALAAHGTGELALAVLGLVLGGVLKGATGAGAPMLAVPAIAMLYDVPTAVAVMATPNLITNSWQAWTFRAERPPPAYTRRMVVSGMIGAAVGTWGLAVLPQDGLTLLVALGVFAYVAFRLARPHWGLGADTARRLSFPMGLLSGLMQGASGLSAPVSLTFLNASRLNRGHFIMVASLFFAGMSVTQIPAQVAFGVLTWPLMAGSAAAVLPILAGMPLGRRLAAHISPQVFDRTILALLAVLGAKLLTDGLGMGTP